MVEVEDGVEVLGDACDSGVLGVPWRVRTAKRPPTPKRKVTADPAVARTDMPAFAKLWWRRALLFSLLGPTRAGTGGDLDRPTRQAVDTASA